MGDTADPAVLLFSLCQSLYFLKLTKIYRQGVLPEHGVPVSL